MRPNANQNMSYWHPQSIPKPSMTCSSLPTMLWEHIKFAFTVSCSKIYFVCFFWFCFVYIVFICSLLVQSGQRFTGNHVPEDPQVQGLTSFHTGSLKSYRMLQNGTHILPNIQSSQALPPFLGGISSLHLSGLIMKSVLQIAGLLFGLLLDALQRSVYFPQ